MSRPDFKALRAQQVEKVQLDSRVRLALAARKDVRDALDDLVQHGGLTPRQDRITQRVLKGLWTPLDPRALRLWLERQERLAPRARRVLAALLAPPTPKAAKVDRAEQERTAFKLLMGRLSSMGMWDRPSTPAALKLWLGRQTRLTRRLAKFLA
jgi:hypothetical protein